MSRYSEIPLQRYNGISYNTEQTIDKNEIINAHNIIKHSFITILLLCRLIYFNSFIILPNTKPNQIFFFPMSEIFNTIFPHPTLTPLSNTTPTGATLRILHQELNANAIAVPSTRGNGTLGHFALVTPAANYLLIATVPFDAPVHPGNAPVHQLNATGAQITEGNRQFTADGKEHTLFINTEAALKNSYSRRYRQHSPRNSAIPNSDMPTSPRSP